MKIWVVLGNCDDPNWAGEHFIAACSTKEKAEARRLEALAARITDRPPRPPYQIYFTVLVEERQLDETYDLSVVWSDPSLTERIGTHVTEEKDHE